MKKDKIFLEKYFDKVNNVLKLNNELNTQILKTKDIFKLCAKKKVK